MQKTELLEMIANGENSAVEFKRDDVSPEKLAREIVAFANTQGGKILLGVEDDGTITGLQRSNTQEWVLNVFRDKVYPQIIPHYIEVAVDDRTKVGVISIAMGVSKPYVLRHNKRDDIYVRMGNRSEIASRELQMRLFESGGLLHVEKLPVAGTSIEDLDLARIDFYFRSILCDPDIPGTQSEWIDRLVDLGLMAEDGLGNKACSVAGLVCFGFLPRRYLHNAGLRVMAFDSDDKEYQALLDRVLDGPLVGRWMTDKSGQKRLVEDGLIESFISTISPFVSVESSFVDENMVRQKQWFYPIEAIRETVINALAHRDWTKPVDIEVSSYFDRLEVISPGKLNNTMTIKNMIAGQRSYRNPIIMNILRDHGYVDARGMGVRTKIIPLMRNINKTDPVFEATDDYLKTVLYRKNSQ
ncbi:putative DNA binding domain-containing protein [Myxococcota bacterium]|jgi:ATP-dependent DNA helicase RecG|nr:putative DNA binding domain-containing protein [Myxococcota bacterium]MBP8970355.1 putative DNA binding domain-containing protein [Myxococcota bacterium]OQC35062.1 MAG: Divergent AAA domain protein [Deltaproteobacteria bacterium ADurb.Bin058]